MKRIQIKKIDDLFKYQATVIKTYINILLKE